MNCLRQSIKNSLDNSYAHHIQRLMITGNYALLTQTSPNEIDAWYLGIYADAIEWVQLPNTRGMSQFADGGLLATKPYVASANYMHKMGDYCSNCSYKHRAKTEEDACPFNALYWDFIARNREFFEKNPRMALPLRTWERMNPAKQRALRDRAESLLSDLEAL